MPPEWAQNVPWLVVVSGRVYFDPKSGYVVHHLDLDPGNDSIENLAVMTREDHGRYHATLWHAEQKGFNDPRLTAIEDESMIAVAEVL